MLNITTGKKRRSHKLVIYGTEGVGKTTLASKLPEPVLFIDTEGSTSRYEVARTEPADYAQFIETLNVILMDPSKYCKSLVIDSIDWAVSQMVEYVCKKRNKTSITEIDYGSGYTYLRDEMQKVLNLLTKIKEKDVHICLIAHVKTRKFELPEEQGRYDKYELKLDLRANDTKLAEMVKEWADTLLFLNFSTTVISVDKKGEKKKAVGTGERIMYTQHHSVFDAKNRDGLPFSLPLDYSHIKHLFEDDAISDDKSVEQSKSNGVGNDRKDIPKEITENFPDVEVVSGEYAKTPEMDTRLAKLLEADQISETEYMKCVHEAYPSFGDVKITELPKEFIDFQVQPENWKDMKEYLKNMIAESFLRDDTLPF